MQNVSKPTTSLVNTTKVSFAETWDTWDVAWQDETRTWLGMISLMDNQTVGASEAIWSHRSFPWLLSTPWLNTGGMTNVNRP